MGSFFRKQAYVDIDLVAVLSCDNDALLDEAKGLREELRAIGESIGERFDLTIFTVSEFASNPLRDMADLVPLYRYEGSARG